MGFPPQTRGWRGSQPLCLDQVMGLTSFGPMGLMVSEDISGDFFPRLHPPPPLPIREVTETSPPVGGLGAASSEVQEGVAQGRGTSPAYPATLLPPSLQTGRPACPLVSGPPDSPPSPTPPAAAGQLHSLSPRAFKKLALSLSLAALGIASNLSSAFPLQMVMTTHNSPGWPRLPPARMLRPPRR